MDGDLKWFLGFIAIFFLLWLVGGGIERPLSWSGPFLNPLVPSGVDNSSSVRSGDRPTSIGVPQTAVRIRHSNVRTEDNVSQEYVIIEAPRANSAPVSLLGWTLGGMLIPLAQGGQPVVLAPGGRAVVTVGRISPRPGALVTTSFRTNACTGYLQERYDYSPRLDTNCPAPEREPGADDLREECYNFVSRLAACHEPRVYERNGERYVDGRRDIGFSCREYLAEHFSYERCLAIHAADADFWQNEWRVFLNSTRSLGTHESGRVELRDSFGRLVDEISWD